jgi:hypothetical protein
MPSLKWNTIYKYENLDPCDIEQELKYQRFNTLKWDLNLDADSRFSLEDLEEMMAERESLKNRNAEIWEDENE